MKNKLILLLMLLIGASAFAQSLEEAEALAGEGQYLSAIGMLNRMKESENSPELIDLKARITIDGFVQSINHRMFAFKDLSPGEDILELRASGGDFSMVMGDLKEEVEEYLAAYPDNFHVYKAAGDYYADVLLRYGDGLEEYGSTDLYDLIVSNYEKACSLGCSDVVVIAAVGEYSLRAGDFDKTAEYYKLALKQLPRNASYNYNLSIALQNLEEYESALLHSQIAIEEYDYAPYKADSYHINGFQNRMLGRNGRAIEMYWKALELNPELYFSQSGLLNLLMEEGRFDEADELFNSVFIRNINDFSKLHEFVRLYFTHDEVERVTLQLQSMITRSGDNIHKGTMHYYLGIIDNSLGRSPEENLLKARELYLKEMSDQEGIIKHIDSFLAEAGA